MPKDPTISPRREPPSPAQAIEAMSGDPNFMTSLARGLAVIRGFSNQKKRMTIADLSRRTGIPRAAVRRCLYTLARLGYVNSDDSGGFSLSPTILTLGHTYFSSSSLTTAAQPILDRLSSQVQESCSLAVLEGDEILYVARSSAAPRIMSIDLGIGSRLPAYCTSMGRVLLAGLPPEALDAYLSRVSLVKHTEHTVTSSAELRRVLDEVRATGYAIVDQELEINLRSVAAPVQDPAGRVVAAMNIGTPIQRVSPDDIKTTILPALLAATRELSLLIPPGSR
jgi:IclR family transcriptional regulator, pca regulon regulatory protein